MAGVEFPAVKRPPRGPAFRSGRAKSLQALARDIPKIEPAGSVGNRHHPAVWRECRPDTASERGLVWSRCKADNNPTIREWLSRSPDDRDQKKKCWPNAIVHDRHRRVRKRDPMSYHAAGMSGRSSTRVGVRRRFRANREVAHKPRAGAKLCGRY